MVRWIYAAAAVLLVSSLLVLRRETQSVMHYPVVLATGAPARVYEPGPPRGPFTPPTEDRERPALVLAHGFAGTAGMVSSLARAAARAGWVVVTPDLRGHGQNAAPMDESFAESGRDGLVEDLDAAVEWARTSAVVDPQRVAVAGHSMGGFAALRYAARDPSVASAIGISGGAAPRGPYPPPNVLLVFASGDPQGIRESMRAAGAALAGRERVVLDRTYGDLARSTAVRVSEVTGVDHVTILFSRAGWSPVLDWLAATTGPPDAAPAPLRTDGRYLASGLGLVAFVVLLVGASRVVGELLPRAPPLPTSGALRSFGLVAVALAVSAALLGGIDLFAVRGPFAFVPILGARDVQGFFALAGGVLLVLLAREGRISADGLLDLRSLAGSLLLFAFVYVGLGALLQPFHDLWLAPARLPWFLLGSALTLPFFVGLESALRAPGGRGLWQSLAARLLVAAAVVLLAGVGVLPFVLLLAVPALVALFLLTEAIGAPLARAGAGPWPSAIVQSLLVSWTPCATFPLVG